MAQFIIPTIYTAVDRMTAPVLRMQTAVANLGTVAVRAQRQFNNFLPNMDAAVKNRLNSMVSMAKTMVLIGAGMLTVDSLMQYEKELANLKALTGVTGKEFQRFKDIIQSTAKETKTSAVEVAQGFTTIANAMPQLLTSADGLGKVTSASILLAKAARMELTPAADAVTTLLNQFGKGAEHAAGLVDMMAAGSKYGSAEIEDLSQSLREFGKQAVISGVSLRESITMTELVSQFRKGSQAGIEMRNVLIEMSKGAAQDPKALKDMQRLGVNIALVANSATPISVRLKELQKVVGDSTALFNIFGKENQAMAIALLQNADRFETLNQQLGETGVAARMAEENTQTLYYALIELKAAWVNIVTASKGGNAAMTVLGDTVRFLGNHLGAVVNIATPFVAVLATWQIGILAVSAATKVAAAATVAYTVATGFLAGIMGTMPAIVMSSRAAFYAYTVATYTAAAASRLFGHGALGVANIMMGLPLVLGVAAVAFAMIHSRMTDTYEASEQMRKSLDRTEQGFRQIRKPMNDAQIALNAYNAEMDAYNERGDYARHLDFERRRGGFHAMTFRLMNPIKDLENTLWQQQLREGTAGIPAPMDFFKGVTPGKYEVQTPESQSDTSVHVYVNVNKDGSVSTHSNNNSGTAIPVTVKQTGWPQFQ